MPENILAATNLLPSGEVVLTPPLTDFHANTYRIVIEGLFHFREIPFDALYVFGPDGTMLRQHEYLRWTPQMPPPVEKDILTHRYVFEVPADWKMDGQSVGIQLDTDRWVNETFETPSTVRQELTGDVLLKVLETPLITPIPWLPIGLSCIPLLGVVGGLGWVVRRRMAFQGLSSDLIEAMARLEKKHRAAQQAAQRLPGLTSERAELRDKVNALGAGGFSLIRRVQELRNAQKLVDKMALTRQEAALQERLTTDTNRLDAATRREAEETLAQSRKTLRAVADREQAESRCLMRLARIEAVLDAACLTLRSVPPSQSAAAREDALCRELDAEVSAIQEVTREIPEEWVVLENRR
jgi:hypothetical protein